MGKDPSVQILNSSLVSTSTGQESQKEAKERGQNLPECTGGVGDNNLPNMQGCLANNQLGIRAAHVQPGQDPVPPLHTKHMNDGLEKQHEHKREVNKETMIRGLFCHWRAKEKHSATFFFFFV